MAAIRDEEDWLATARAQILGGDLVVAQTTLAQALIDYPASVELRRAQAGVFLKIGHIADAERLFGELLVQNPGDSASAFPFAHLLQEQGRTAAAASVLRDCLASEPHARDANLAISAIELLDDCGRKRDAAAIAETVIDANPDDPRLRAYAGMLEIQLGEFERARQHYLFALEHDGRAWDWHVPIGLSSAQRYGSDDHPDFGLFRDGLRREGLSDLARAELHFALGKAHDDIGDYWTAARHFREGNAIRRRLTQWSRKAWRRMVEARLAASPIAHSLEPARNFTPIFIVGMPRSGTTLLAELLSHESGVCNRGEQPWLARLAQLPDLSGAPGRAALRHAASIYAARSRQDDADGVRWFIDKQPLNFRYVDLALAMFPDAKVIHCQRSPRDTALSLWMQCFLEDVQGYAYDFGDIATVMRDERRLMAHWRERYPDSIRSVRYEDLVTAPTDTVAKLAAWIGLPASLPKVAANAASSPEAISTASLWQARQPVTSRSIGRWKNYASAVPELLGIPGELE